MSSYSKAQLKDLYIEEGKIKRAKAIDDTISGAYRHVIEKAKAGMSSVIYPIRDPEIVDEVIRNLKRLFPDSTVAIQSPVFRDHDLLIYICWT